MSAQQHVLPLAGVFPKGAENHRGDHLPVLRAAEDDHLPQVGAGRRGDAAGQRDGLDGGGRPFQRVAAGRAHFAQHEDVPRGARLEHRLHFQAIGLVVKGMFRVGGDPQRNACGQSLWRQKLRRTRRCPPWFENNPV